MLRNYLKRINVKNEVKATNANLQLTKSLMENIRTFKTIFKNDNTIIYRETKNLYHSCFSSFLIYIEGMVNSDITNKNIINTIMNADLSVREEDFDLLNKLENKIICTNQITRSGVIDELLYALFSGDAVLIVDGFEEALILSSKGWQTRALAEPETEKGIRGPKEGFTEAIMVNLSLIRRRLKTRDLKFKFREIGIRSKTKICICYIETLAPNDILEELERRLDELDIDGIIDSGYIQELIKDSPLAPFKTLGNTERPDVVAAKLLEGRIAVVVDGSPDVLTLPFVFMEYFQVAEDYYTSYSFASVNRLIRCLGEFFTTSIPAIYLALITFHQEIIPTPLLLSISAARQGVPFPTIVEALVLLFAFEIIREAGVRMPSPLGQSVSIVGALILGQAAVEARIFSAPMVIIVAATGITGLLTLKLKGASILIRLILLLLASVLGLYGYVFGVIGFLILMFSMRSFGIPYMLEFGSINPVDLKDVFIRAPWWYMIFRPKLISAKNTIRQVTSKLKGK